MDPMGPMGNIDVESPHCGKNHDVHSSIFRVWETTAFHICLYVKPSGQTSMLPPVSQKSPSASSMDSTCMAKGTGAQTCSIRTHWESMVCSYPIFNGNMGKLPRNYGKL